jgi:hypothetical protein
MEQNVRAEEVQNTTQVEERKAKKTLSLETLEPRVAPLALWAD